MEDYFVYYLRADNLLRLIAEKPQKKLLIEDVPTFYMQLNGIEILLSNDLIECLGDHDRQLLHVTLLGEQHLADGGFTVLLNIEFPKSQAITFRTHLEDNVNLLTIFGILNALIIFSQQGKDVDPYKLDLFNNGMQLVSISMYVLSILVLIELINNSIVSDNKSRKFQTFHLCMLLTTLGIGLIFLDKYFDLLMGLGLAFMILIVAGTIAGILGVIKFLIPKRSLLKLEKRNQTVILIQIMLALMITYFIIKITHRLIFNH